MKKHILFFTVILIFLIVMILTCTQPGGSSGGSSGDSGGDRVTTTILVQSEFIETVTVSTITNFPMGYPGIADPVHTVPLISSFKMGRYEVTYKEWSTVRTWAQSNGYTFANWGREGSDGTNGGVPTIAKNEPVTTINWRDAIVWCNAASQYDGLTPVYYTNAGLTAVLKVSTNTASINTAAGSEDNPYMNWSANGYRLPTEAEWEAAARYQNGTTWTNGDYASGAGDNISEPTSTGNVAWYFVNAGSVTHDVGTKNANQLVIFDMSGNVFEWCWDWYGVYTTFTPYTNTNPKGSSTGSSRLLRGGDHTLSTSYLQVAFRYTTLPVNKNDLIGFRVARNN